MKHSIPQETAKSPPSATASRRDTAIAAAAIIAIGVHLGLRLGGFAAFTANVPLMAVLAVAGSVQVGGLALRVAHGEFGSDLLAGISIVTSALLGEYLAGSIVVLMLAGGAVLEQYAVRRGRSLGPARQTHAGGGASSGRRRASRHPACRRCCG